MKIPLMNPTMWQPTKGGQDPSSYFVHDHFLFLLVCDQSLGSDLFYPSHAPPAGALLLNSSARLIRSLLGRCCWGQYRLSLLGNRDLEEASRRVASHWRPRN
jgi:hypothetical protein